MKTSEKPYRHIVLFQFRPTVDDATLKTIEKAFADLAAHLPFVVDFEGGRDSSPEGLNQGLTHCFVVSFASPADRDKYIPHPAHQEFIRRYVDPYVEKACVVDFAPTF